jgi:hypothetical protein
MKVVKLLAEENGEKIAVCRFSSLFCGKLNVL